MKKNNNTICFVAGRSGGHLVPCITKAAQLAEEQQLSVLFFTTATSLDKKILTESPFISHVVRLSLENVPYKKIHRYPFFMWQFLSACIVSARTLRAHRPGKVISMGGYVSIPVCLVAYLLRIPIELYELNVIPGKTIQFLSSLSDKVFVCFEQSKRYFPPQISTLTQYPIRFSKHEQHASQELAYKHLAFEHARKTILILGGSQGSIFLNTLIKEWIISHAASHSLIQIIHQTGNLESFDWQKFYASHGIPAILFDYRPDIAMMYSAADVIICRAGAGTLFEATFFHKKCITIPLQTATTDHQLHNAYAMAAIFPHLVTVIEQKDIENDYTLFFNNLTELVLNHHIPSISPTQQSL